jgi:hypothetical protein
VIAHNRRLNGPSTCHRRSEFFIYQKTTTEGWLFLCRGRESAAPLVGFRLLGLATASRFGSPPHARRTSLRRPTIATNEAVHSSCIKNTTEGWYFLCRGRESDSPRQPLQGCALPLSYLGALVVSVWFLVVGKTKTSELFVISYWLSVIWSELKYYQIGVLRARPEPNRRLGRSQGLSSYRHCPPGGE